MGITGLWEVLGEGKVVHIADYAAQHFQRHKRPLRIAVDEACWRFCNLTNEQVEKIRQGEPAANPIEAVILWRVLRLKCLNIQLIFVHDGLSRPGKDRRKGAGNRLEKEIVRLLRQLLDHLKIPYHQAPGEAEAECAKLQRLGIVDAVWSDDGDAFMFGCTTLIKQHKKPGKRDTDHIRVYDADQLKRKFDFDEDSFLMFALLAGGDYDLTGLRGCGPQTAKLLSTRTSGLGAAARVVQQTQLPAWRQDLRSCIQRQGKHIAVPEDFPKYKSLCNYRNPNVSSDEAASNLRALRPNGQGWDKQIDQTKLRVLLRHRFNFDTRRFIQKIAPNYLAKALAQASNPDRCQENLQYCIQLKRTVKRKAKDTEDDTDLSSQSKKRSRSQSANVSATPGPSKPRKRKKKQSESYETPAKDPTPPPTSPNFRRPKVPRLSAATVIDLDESSSDDESGDVLPDLAELSSQRQAGGSLSLVRQSLPKLAVFGHGQARAPKKTFPCSEADDDGDPLFVSPAKPDFRGSSTRKAMPCAAPVSSRPSATATQASPSHDATSWQARQTTGAAKGAGRGLVAGESISPATIRALRASLSFLSDDTAKVSTAKTQQSRKHAVRPTMQPEVIDLT